ncbi:MAG: alkaline phosphatase family protein [Nanoarchaeota archaeon]
MVFIQAGKPVSSPKIIAQCNDHKDNDGDGYCDFAWAKGYCSDGSILGDPDCSAKDDKNETAPCTVQCSSASQCGTDGYVAANYCGVDGNVYRDYQTFSCSNAGTCASVCSSQTASRLIQTCSLGCSEGRCIAPPINDSEKKQVILIGVDGMQVAHYLEMKSQGKLPNLDRLVADGGWVGNATITGHARTETAPGNAELHSGLPDTVTSVVDNTCGISLPDGDSVFERLSVFNPSVSLGLIYGKGTCYIPEAVLANAKPVVSWWHNRTSYPQRTYISSNCANSIDVANKSLEFISTYKNDSFYLVAYFGVPDCAGHAYGENSVQYGDSLINVDDGLGIILDALAQYGIASSTKILLTADHGWNEGTTGHGTAAADTKTLPLLSNNANLVNTIYSQGIRKQCDVAPTILNYFGMNSGDYQEITDANCGSLIGV